MLDVIITSTCRNTIIKTIESFLQNVSYSGDYNFIVNVDVLNPGFYPKLIDYLKKKNINNINVNSSPVDSKINLARAMSYLYNNIKTPFAFNLEDDWIFLKNINLDPLINIMQKHFHVNHIRFSKEKIKKECWLYYLSNEKESRYLAPNIQTEIENIPLVKTSTWSFNPSLIRTSAVKNFIYIPTNTRSETYVCRKYLEIFGEDGCYIYGNIGDPAIIKDIGRNRIREFLRKVNKCLKNN